MKTLTVKRTSIFPACRNEVFLRLQRLRTLQFIAWPYAMFTPKGGSEDMIWKAGSSSSYILKLFGVIPFGTHTIHVIRFSEKNGIYTHEGNEHVPVWNHEIILRESSEETCEYTDQVEIGAGWKTPFIYVWACGFYAHRQRRWIQLLQKQHRRKTYDPKRSNKKRV